MSSREGIFQEVESCSHKSRRRNCHRSTNNTWFRDCARPSRPGLDSSLMYYNNALMHWSYRRSVVMNQAYWTRYFAMYSKAFEEWSQATNGSNHENQDYDDDDDRVAIRQHCNVKGRPHKTENSLKRTRISSKELENQVGNKMPKTEIRNREKVADNCMLGNQEVSSDDELEYAASGNQDDDFEVELNEEFKQFLEISEKHRQEREKEKKKEKKKSKNEGNKYSNHLFNEFDFEYIEAGDQPISATTEAPKSTNKQEEHKEMYGSKYVNILNLEAEVQLNFDKFFDACNPSYWPFIPLKL